MRENPAGASISRERHTRSIAIGWRGVIIMWGVTAGKASNARAVTASKMGHHSSMTNAAGNDTWL